MAGLFGEHCHQLRPSTVDKKARRKLIVASVLCVVFMIGEIIGGVLSSSLAIATDAAHLLTDFASFMISLFALWVASRPASRTMSFGWHRAEVIGALTSVLMIWVVTGILVYLAVERVITRDFEIDSTPMLITSALGIVVNLVLKITGFASDVNPHLWSNGQCVWLRNQVARVRFPVGASYLVEVFSGVFPQPNMSKCWSGLVFAALSDMVLVLRRMGLTLHQHGHSHGASHDSEEGHGNHQHGEKQNINVRAAYIHVLGDFIQSFGVFVAALIIYFKPSWILIDPICTFLFSILVLITTFAIIKDTMLVLMEGIPKGMDFTLVMDTFLKIDGVVRVHNLRIWALSMNKTALAAHLAIAPGVSPQKILQTASHEIRSKFDFFEMTLQIEEFDQNMEDCAQCRCPDS
ncbi:hypothetical protein ANN_00649 [Periplaneta americana]|uniref:Zinc transporter 2-like n=1 Tax=Periplaneta americana TaxID=6978 RepID=A0ABQ8TU84_PERAM|nr:hypothetical protein ANN_00649 [Periplaneta americana]